MSGEITVSVIIPAYNEQGTIIEILQEIKVQEVESVRFEIIVIDDCSTDETLNLLENNRSLYTTLVKLEKNSGKGAAVKAGLERASGTLFFFRMQI